MITLYHAGSDTTVTLPNPELNDGEQRVIKCNTHKLMNGAQFTTISKTDRYNFTLAFNLLTRQQVEDLDDLVSNYGHQGFLYTDYLGGEWNVIVTSNPIEYTEGPSFYTARLDLQGVPA